MNRFWHSNFIRGLAYREINRLEMLLLMTLSAAFQRIEWSWAAFAICIVLLFFIDLVSRYIERKAGMTIMTTFTTVRKVSK
jgi:hypothetical protein